jgi:uncharacterized protein (TIGR03086 family)
MSVADPFTGLRRGDGLLERAIAYTRGVTDGINPEQLSQPTPCRGWNLRTLLRHLNHSLATLHEGIDQRSLTLDPAEQASAEVIPDDELLGSFQHRAHRLLEVWIESAHDADDGTILVARQPLHGIAVANTGALEIAVHGWDIAEARQLHAPIPPTLARQLLEVAHRVVVPSSRPTEFAAPVPATHDATPSDRLMAFLGRDPRHWRTSVAAETN